MSVWSLILDRLAGPMARMDQAAAAASLRGFEAATGRRVMGESPSHTAPADLAGVQRALTPRGRPILEHHWATWCESCLEELPRIQRLADAASACADLVSVSWDTFDDPRPMPLVVAHVDAFERAHALRLRTIVYEGSPDALFDALKLPVHTVPQTRVLDASGGVLRSFTGPIDDHEEQGILELLQSLHRR